MSSRIVRLLSLLLLSLFASLSVGYSQIWVADFSSKGYSKDNGWFFTSDFAVNSSAIHLNGVAPNPRSNSTITEKLLNNFPSDSIRWRAVVTMDKIPTKAFNAHILLAMISPRKDTTRKFVALSLQDNNINFSVVSHSYQHQGDGSDTHKLTISKKQGIIQYPFPGLLVDNRLDIEVSYIKSVGWDINLYTNNFDKSRLIGSMHIDTEEVTLAKENFVGFAAKYTKRSSKAFHCYYYSVSKVGDSTNDNPPYTGDEDEGSNTIPVDKRDGHHIVLNEVMANPSPEAPEFVEIYNPTDKEISLANYYLVYSSGNREQVVDLSKLGNIGVGQYLVLSSRANDIPSFYTGADANDCREINIPRLANNGFVIGIGYGDRGSTFDDVRYSSDYFPRGYKNKKGISLQRIDAKAKSTNTNWIISTDSKYFATPTKANYYKNNLGNHDTKDDTTEVKEGSILQAYNLMTSSENPDVIVSIYDINGALLNHFSSQRAIDIIRSMVENPTSIFPYIPHIHNEMLLMNILFRKSKEGIKRFTYKFYMVSS